MPSPCRIGAVDTGAQWLIWVFDLRPGEIIHLYIICAGSCLGGAVSARGPNTSSLCSRAVKICLAWNSDRRKLSFFLLGICQGGILRSPGFHRRRRVWCLDGDRHCLTPCAACAAGARRTADRGARAGGAAQPCLQRARRLVQATRAHRMMLCPLGQPHGSRSYMCTIQRAGVCA